MAIIGNIPYFQDKPIWEILKAFKDKVHRSIETLDYGHSLLCKWDENEMPRQDVGRSETAMTDHDMT